MIASDFLQSSDSCRVDTVRNDIVLDSGYTGAFMHSGETVCDVVVFSTSVLDGRVNAYVKILPSLEILAICLLLHEGEQEFVICQDYKLVSSQLGF